VTVLSSRRCFEELGVADDRLASAWLQLFFDTQTELDWNFEKLFVDEVR
jgi:hypothetical protein